MKYRPEIDGLRALAVVPVILFHAGFELFSGGFIGVDVFFVISGYLITTILIEDIENKRFNLLNFYERRARRILPALFFVMLVCIPFAWMWMLPDPLENFGQSLVAATLSANNILLYLTSGYWDLASEFKPLLHTWSLGVEEQYYVIFPLLLLLTWRFGKGIVLLSIIVITSVSLALSEWLSRENSEAAFFLIHTRAWELLAGSICAFFVQRRGVQKNNPLALLGLAAIIFVIFFYDETTPFPSAYTLVPVLGVVLLVLYADNKTLAAKFLSTKGFVGIGLVSYSAYLWHQPLFAFSKIHQKTEPSLLLNAVLIFATFLLSYASWKYIEKPFRNKSMINAQVFLLIIAISALGLLGFGYSAHKSHGFVERIFDESVRTADMYISYNQRNFSYKENSFETDLEPKILVIGNSFGRDFVNVLRETYDFTRLELVYRDDYDVCNLFQTDSGEVLYKDSDIIVFASNYDASDTLCIDNALRLSSEVGASLFLVGTKQFGFNHNWIARTEPDERKLLRNPVLQETMDSDIEASNAIPSTNYISLMQTLNNNEGVIVTDEFGRLISPDRAHLTRYGAIFIGREIILESQLGKILQPLILDE
ncbi:acyltransferase [Amylibacter sp.]|jgi:peptidoglycan/LPS O-acetylase OafA/YrhL|nr:acyltransferase [Amylibacter sp.]